MGGPDEAFLAAERHPEAARILRDLNPAANIFDVFCEYQLAGWWFQTFFNFPS